MRVQFPAGLFTLNVKLFLVAFSSAFTLAAQAQQTPIDDLEFADAELQRCVQEETRYEEFADEVRYLSCTRYDVKDVQGIGQLNNLESLTLRSENVAVLANIEAINSLTSLQWLGFLNYANSTASFAQLDTERLPLRSLSLLTTPNVDDSIYPWLYQFSGLQQLIIGDVPVTTVPDPSQLPNLTRLSIRNTPIRPNQVVALWGDSTLTSLSLGGYGTDRPPFDTASWQLPSTLTYLMLRYGRLDSLTALSQTLQTNDIQLESIVLGVETDDWSSLGSYASDFPSITTLDLGFSNFDDFAQLANFSNMDRVYLDFTKDADGGIEPVLTLLENSPDIWSVYLGNVSYLHCEDRALLDNSGYSSLELSYFGDACRTDEYQFRLLNVADDYGAIVAADSIHSPRTLGAYPAAQSGEIVIDVLPKYDESWDEQIVRVAFENGTNRDFALRYPQPKTEPVRIADIEFADSNLAGCVTDSLDMTLNIQANDGEIPEYAHEMHALLCDASSGYYAANLNGLEHFTQLEILQMLGEDEQIQDITPLLALKQLNWLTLSNKGLTDDVMAPMRGYRSVARDWQSLHLGGNVLTDQTLFDDWINGTKPFQVILANNSFTTLPQWLSESDFNGTLNVSGLPLADLQADLTQLQNSSVDRLYLGTMNIGSVADLIFPDSLTVLGLSNNGLTTMDGFTAPANLTGLRLDNNPGITVDGLASVAGLETLTLVNSEISSLAVIQQLPHLRQLSLNQNEIDDLAVLTDLSREDYLFLDLSFNPATDYGPALDKSWLTLQSQGNAHVACSQFEAFDASATTLYWNVCQQENGQTRINPAYINGDVDGAVLAQSSQRYGRVELVDGVLNFLPKPGVEGWITVDVMITYADGTTQMITLQLYIEPGTNPATSQGIPIVILVSGQEDKAQ